MATNFVYSITGTSNEITANGSATIPQTGLVDLEFTSPTTISNDVTMSGTVTCATMTVGDNLNIWSTNPTSSGQGLLTDHSGNLSWADLPANTTHLWQPNLRVSYSSGISPQSYVCNVYLERKGNIVTLTIDLASLISAAGAAYPITLISANPVWSFDTFDNAFSGDYIPVGYYPNSTFFPTISGNQYGGHYYLGTLPVYIVPTGGGSPTYFNAAVSLYSVNTALNLYSLSITPGGYSYQAGPLQEFDANITQQYYLGATGSLTSTGTVDQISSVSYTYYAQ